MIFEDVLVETQGHVGLITLNRPKALNALSFAMVEAIDDALARFATDATVQAVVLRSSSERAYCAGGDVKVIITNPPTPEETRAYFGREYRLNYRLHCFPKPVVALMDGITMGGGCGISLHASHPVATERTVLSMPETVLGLFPDVGAGWFFGKLPGEMGVYLSLTGLRLGPDDVVALGLAGHKIASADRHAVVEALIVEPELDRAGVSSLLTRFNSPAETSVVFQRRTRVDELFSGETVEIICSGLATAPEMWAQEALDVLKRASPTSLKVTLRQMRHARTQSIAEIIRTDYRLAIHATVNPDFREGVRAILVDRDNAPKWHPSRLDAVSDALVAAWFAPLAPGISELDLDL